MRRLLLTVLCLLPTTLLAERYPLSRAELFEGADLVVVGTIVDLQISTERSHIETGFGNYDWAIDLTLHVSDVEKGDYAEKTLVARCFRVKSRKTQVEFLTPSGNHPIPEVGTTVRAHLYRRRDSRWRVVYPNGLVDPQGKGDWPEHRWELTSAQGVDTNASVVFQEGPEWPDAQAVQRLRVHGYTYLWPVNRWKQDGLVVLIAVAGLSLVVLLVWKIGR